MKILSKISDYKKFKFVKDSIYTLLSFIVFSVSGIILNIIIGNHYGASGLGIYNQSLAIFMISSIIAVFGLNITVVKYISQYNSELEIQKCVFSTASLLAFLFSVSVTVFIFIIASSIPSFFFNEEVTQACSVIAISLPFFILNKLFMALLNAKRFIKIYAIVQSIRWILILGFTSIAILMGSPIHLLFYSFLITESSILAYFILILNKYFSLNALKYEWFKKTFVFGGKSVLISFLGETNNKVDIFLISFFLSNYHVGVYSFAATIIKGFLSIAQVIQLNVNPIISQLWEKHDLEAIQQYSRQIAKTMLFIMTPILILSGIFYPFFIQIFMNDPTYYESIPIFYILLFGIFLPSIYYFAGAYLSMANFLNVSLLYLVMVLLFNITFCFILINIFSFFGAALSTSLTYIFSVILLFFTIRNNLNINIFGGS